MFPNLDPPTTDKERVAFVKEWNEWFMENTATYKGVMGMWLAYLWPAIVKGNVIEAGPQSAIVKLLRQEGVPEDEDEYNSIWDFIDLGVET